MSGLNEAVADSYRGPWVHARGASADRSGRLRWLMVPMRSLVSWSWATGRRRSVRWPRCPPPGACWIVSMRSTWRRCMLRGSSRGSVRGLPGRDLTWARSWASTSTPRSRWPTVRRENAAATWKRTFGFHPLLAFLDRPECANGEALAGLLRAGNAGSNTAADHVEVRQLALAGLPPEARPRPGDPESPRVLARSDSAGATHTFAAACRQKGVGFSFGFPVDFRIKDIVDAIPATAWYPAIEYDDMREGAWVTEATENVDLSAWPEGSRLILRKERPHPGAQLTFTDVEGMRITAFLTDTPLESSRVRSPGWSYVTVSTLGWRTVSGRPRPLACVTCHVEPGTRTWPGCRSCSWPPIWSPGPNSSPSPTLPPWPSARSPRSATASCTSLPTPPEAPDKYAYALTGPGAGPQRSPPAGAEYAPPSADRPTLSQRPGEPRNPAHPATTAGPSSCPDPAPGPETDPTLADRRRTTTT